MSDFRGPEWTGRGPSDVPSRNPNPNTLPPQGGQGPGAPRPSYEESRRLKEEQAKPLSSIRYTKRRHRRSSSRSGGSSSSSKRKIRYLWLLAVVLTSALVASCVIAVMIFFQVDRMRNDNRMLEAEQLRLEQELEKARDRIAELNNDQRILLANRLPGIDQIVFDRQLELNNQYVKTITFVKSGLGDDTTIEFSALLENARTGPILPRVTIVLFDEAGLQTGAVVLDQNQTVSPVVIPEMQPGEKRTYSGRVELQRLEPSKYFVVEVR
jgi:outer membrane murein-binding lipoprotein Lpp